MHWMVGPCLKVTQQQKTRTIITQCSHPKLSHLQSVMREWVTIMVCMLRPHQWVRGRRFYGGWVIVHCPAIYRLQNHDVLADYYKRVYLGTRVLELGPEWWWKATQLGTEKTIILLHVFLLLSWGQRRKLVEVTSHRHYFIFRNVSNRHDMILSPLHWTVKAQTDCWRCCWISCSLYDVMSTLIRAHWNCTLSCTRDCSYSMSLVAYGESSSESEAEEGGEPPETTKSDVRKLLGLLPPPKGSRSSDKQPVRISIPTLKSGVSRLLMYSFKLLWWSLSYTEPLMLIEWLWWWKWGDTTSKESEIGTFWSSV